MIIPLTKENGKTLKPETINAKKKNEIFDYLKDKEMKVTSIEEKETFKIRLLLLLQVLCNRVRFQYLIGVQVRL